MIGFYSTKCQEVYFMKKFIEIVKLFLGILKKSRKMQIILLLLFCIWLIWLFNCSYYYKSEPLLTHRAYHKSILMNNGQILVTGGIDNCGNQNIGIKSAEIVGLGKDKTRESLQMQLPHLFHEMFTLSNGNILIADINGIEIYDVKTKKFKLLKTKPSHRHAEFTTYSFSLLPNDRLVVLGGRKHDGKEKEYDALGLVNLNQGEIIDIKNDRLIKTFPIEGTGFGTVVLKNGDLLILGGKKFVNKEEKIIDDIYLLNSATLELKHIGYLEVAVFKPFVFQTSDNKAIVIGGMISWGETWKSRGYSLVIDRGSPFIQIINLNPATYRNPNLKDTPKGEKSEYKISSIDIKVKDISNILLKHEAVKNKILDVVQYSDELYWVRPRSINLNNTILLDIGKNRISEKKVLYPPSFIHSYSFFKGNNIKVNNEIVCTGGKLRYAGPTEYTIFDDPVPVAKEQYYADCETYIGNVVNILRVK